MNMIPIATGDDAELEALLACRIYEYNAAASGHADGESFSASVRNGDRVDAGIYGYTWGGCCYVSYFGSPNRCAVRGSAAVCSKPPNRMPSENSVG